MTHPWRSYVAVGDSFTEGLADYTADGTPRGWADRLASALADRAGEPVRYANLAIRGRLLGPIVAEQLEPALALKPDLVSLVGGGNDLLRPDADPDVLAATLESAVVQLRRAGIDVLLGTGVDPLGSPIIQLTRGRVAISNAHIHSIARRHGAYVFDQWGMLALRDFRLWDADRLHLNPLGHDRIAQAALVALGLEPDIADWADPLPPEPMMSRRDTLLWNLTWGREHLAPWVGRRLRRTSSGANRTAKQAQYRLVNPTTAAQAE